jgi:GlcNAc-PI de-N-acetylase
MKLYDATTWISSLSLLVPIVGGSGEIHPSERVRYVSNQSLRVDVVLVAHQDDWQLFMGDIVLRQIRRNPSQVVFVYLTAGDRGRDSLYWATRERGALESTRVAVGLTATDSAADQCSVARIFDHSIRKCVIANTESYFLRLPDGRRGGAGFAIHSFQSLRKLRAKRIASIAAVDESATYKDWADLISTVSELIGASSEGRIVTIHTNDPSVVVNPHDHFDHRIAGLLVADSRRRSRWNVAYYAGYSLATRAPNRTKDQAQQKTALFLAYDRVIAQVNDSWSAYREHPAFYSKCMVRTYARRLIAR